jgi:hypothetical protein
MYVYIQSETSPDLFTVGFYQPDGSWEPDSDHPVREDAANRVASLNGETPPDYTDVIYEELKRWERSLSGCIFNDDVMKEAITLNNIIHGGIK